MPSALSLDADPIPHLRESERSFAMRRCENETVVVGRRLTGDDRLCSGGEAYHARFAGFLARLVPRRWKRHQPRLEVDVVPLHTGNLAATGAGQGYNPDSVSDLASTRCSASILSNVRNSRP